LSAEELFEGVECVVLGADVEDRLVLVVAQLEVFFRAVEVLDEHVDVVVLKGVVERQVSVEVLDVGAGADLVNDWVLLVDTHDMFDSLSLEVLLSTRLEELIIAGEPVENVFISVPGADKEHILTQVVRFLQRLVLVFLEDFEHFDILGLDGDKEWELALEIRLHALFGAHLEQFSSEVMLARPRSDVERRVSLECVAAGEDVQIGEHFRVEQVI